VKRALRLFDPPKGLKCTASARRGWTAHKVATAGDLQGCGPLPLARFTGDGSTGFFDGRAGLYIPFLRREREAESGREGQQSASAGGTLTSQSILLSRPRRRCHFRTTRPLMLAGFAPKGREKKGFKRLKRATSCFGAEVSGPVVQGTGAVTVAEHNSRWMQSELSVFFYGFFRRARTDGFFNRKRSLLGGDSFVPTP